MLEYIRLSLIAEYSSQVQVEGEKSLSSSPSISLSMPSSTSHHYHYHQHRLRCVSKFSNRCDARPQNSPVRIVRQFVTSRPHGSRFAWVHGVLRCLQSASAAAAAVVDPFSWHTLHEKTGQPIVMNHDSNWKRFNICLYIIFIFFIFQHMGKAFFNSI